MYCPQCGREIKTEVQFCSNCGTRLPEGAKKQAVSRQPQPVRLWLSRQKKKTGGFGMRRFVPFWIGGAALFFVLFFFVFHMGKTAPALTEQEQLRLLKEYLAEHLADEKQSELVEACLSNEVDDLMDQLSKRLSSLLESAGITIENREKKELLRQLKNQFADYVKQKPENQAAFAYSVTEASRLEITGQKQKGKRLQSKVTVSYLDFSAVNQKLLQEAGSVSGMVKLFTGGDLFSKLTGTAFGEVEALLEAFLAAAEMTQERKSYTGSVEFFYHKETEEWEVSSVDWGIWQAYFAVK